MSLLARVKRRIDGNQRISQLSNPNPNLAVIVYTAFRRCLEYDGIPFTEDLLEEAIREADKYPKLTISQFIEGIYNIRMQSGLRKL